MKKNDRPLSGAADLQRKLTRMARVQQDAKTETSAEEAAPPASEDAPDDGPKRGQREQRKRPVTRGQASRSNRPAEVERILLEGRADEATAAVLQALAAESAGSRHVQVKMPAWLHRDWSVYVAAQGREVREVLLSIILEKLSEALREGLIP